MRDRSVQWRIGLAFLAGACVGVLLTAHVDPISKAVRHTTESLLRPFDRPSGHSGLRRYGTDTDRAKRILWIGNSHTDHHDVPGLLFQLTEADSPAQPIWIQSLTHGGYSLLDHLHEGQLQKLFDKHAWDFIILQERSWAANGVSHEMLRALDTFVFGHFKQSHAELILFQNWAYSSDYTQFYAGNPSETPQQMQQEINQFFHYVEARYPIRVAPIGHALAQSYHPEATFKLVSGDGNHLHRDGAIVAALVLYQTLFQHPPQHPEVLKPSQDIQGLATIVRDGFQSYPP